MNAIGLAYVLLSATFASVLSFAPDAPNELTFPAQRAKFVRFVILANRNGQPCLDELEVYSPDGKENLALRSHGAKASASSCLAGYTQHAVAHLNDGRYGNDYSWIAATARVEWAQIELPSAVDVGKVVFSRDRKKRYRDRMPLAIEVRVSTDGRTWKTTCRAKQAGFVMPVALPEPVTRQGLVRYAMLCERKTWQQIHAADHISPLRVERSAMPGGEPYWGRIARLDPTARVLVQLGEMIERLAAKGLDVTQERARLVELRRRQAALGGEADPAANETLYLDARLAKRSLMFRDPDLGPLQRILFVKRHPYLASHNYSDILDSRFRPGGGICVLTIPRLRGRLEPSAAELTTLFDASDGIARDPVTDFDGQTIFFAYRPNKSPVPGRKCYWHLMSMRPDGSRPNQLSDGPFHDHSPCPLPDGGLGFISTRCRSRFLCWRPQAFVLFRMEADGRDIRPLSFANLSEWTPATMRDGRILWTRSEYLDKGANFGHTLWAIRPDGTHPELVFGNNTINCYINGHEVPDSREICCTIFSHGGDHNGPLGLIDLSKGPFDSSALTNITPDIKPYYDMNSPRTECFRDPMPVSRDHYLASHAPGAHGRFGLYVVDRWGNRELLYLDPAIGSMAPTPLRPRPRPVVLESRLPEVDETGMGQFTVTDVYEGLGTRVPRGTVKYLRVCQEVRSELEELPGGEFRDDHPPFQDFYATPVHKVSGPFGWPSYVAKASLGIVPVEADGSANFRAPAGKVLYFEVLDEEFNEIQRMRSVVQLQPGERRSCVGCHEDRKATPLVRRTIAARREPSRLETPPWGAKPFSYENVVQPVWDARCVRCHDATDKRGFNLAGTLDAERVPASYRTLIAGGWVHYFNWGYAVRHHKAEPLEFGTLKSKLWQVLAKETPEGGHYGVTLTREETRRVKCWIDLNCPLWPDYTYRPDRPKSVRRTNPIEIQARSASE